MGGVPSLVCDLSCLLSGAAPYSSHLGPSDSNSSQIFKRPRTIKVPVSLSHGVNGGLQSSRHSQNCLCELLLLLMKFWALAMFLSDLRSLSWDLCDVMWCEEGHQNISSLALSSLLKKKTKPVAPRISPPTHNVTSTGKHLNTVCYSALRIISRDFDRI